MLATYNTFQYSLLQCNIAVGKDAYPIISLFCIIPFHSSPVIILFQRIETPCSKSIRCRVVWCRCWMMDSILLKVLNSSLVNTELLSVMSIPTRPRVAKIKCKCSIVMVDLLAVTCFTFIHLQWASIKMRKCWPSIIRMYSYPWLLWPCPWLKWSNRWLSLQVLTLFASLNSLFQIFIYLWPLDKTSCQSLHSCSIRMFFMYTYFLADLVSSLRSTSTCEYQSM